MGELVIQNVNVVLPDQVLENGSVRLQDQLIQEVSENPWLGPESPDGRILDGQGAFLLPGLIDIHSDNIETVIQPRPQSMTDFELAMREQEAAPGVRQDTGARLPSVSIRISPTVYWSGLRVRR